MTRFDRRRLLTSGAAAAVLMGAGVGAAARPKRGGLLRAVLSGAQSGDGWDGRGHDRTFMQVAAQGAVFETLTEVAPDGGLRGELLSHWQPHDAGRVWDLNLRPDARFHDGKPVGAHDVIASLARHRAAGLHLARRIERAEARGDVLRLTLNEPDPRLPYLLSDPRLIVAPEGRFDLGIGSGLYRVVDFRPGEIFEGRRVADHPRLSQAGWFDEIALQAVDGRAAQERLLRDRRADVGDLARLEGDGFTLHHVSRGAAPQGFDGLRAFDGYALTAHMRVAVPQVLGAVWPMDNARIAERWWMA